MKQWPPELPDNNRSLEALGALIEQAKESLQQEELSPLERKIADSIRPGNTTVALTDLAEESPEAQLAVLLETTRKIVRFRSFNVLSAGPVEQHFCLPIRTAHAAVNSLSRVQAYTLADLLASDFVTFMQEQYEFAKQAGAPKKELRMLSMKRFTEPLKSIHQQIRSRSLPLFES